MVMDNGVKKCIQLYFDISKRIIIGLTQTIDPTFRVLNLEIPNFLM